MQTYDSGINYQPLITSTGRNRYLLTLPIQNHASTICHLAEYTEQQPDMGQTEN